MPPTPSFGYLHLHYSILIGLGEELPPSLDNLHLKKKVLRDYNCGTFRRWQKSLLKWHPMLKFEMLTLLWMTGLMY